jgi:hypothetical protein
VIFAKVVEVANLLEVIWASLIAGVGFVTAGSLAIYGAARANTARRDGHAAEATLYGAIGIAGALLCAAGVVLGVSVMLSKG